jgi:hypothetical protein
MGKCLVIALLLVGLEGLLVATVVSASWLAGVTAAEQQGVARLGEDVAVAVAVRGRTWFNQLFVHPGTVAASYREVSPWLAQRLNAGWDSVRLTVYRLAYLADWARWLAPLALAVVLDGGLKRRIKRAGFGNLSPLRHRYGWYALLTLVFVVLFSLWWPAPLPVWWLPVLLAGLLGCLWLVLSNTQRRV